MIPTALTLAVFAWTDLQAANRGLDLKVQVVEALEGGPVILDVVLTNRKNEAIFFSKLRFNEIHIPLPASWNATNRFPCGGGGVSRISQWIILQPGESLTEHQSIHVDYVSRFPAGTFKFSTCWPLGRVTPKDVPAMPFTSLQIKLLPATPENVAAFGRRLEAAFANLPTDKTLIPALEEISERIHYTPHKALVPFELKLLDKCPIGKDRFDYDSWVLRRGLVETIFHADPDKAHRIFVDRFTAKVQTGDPALVFQAWSALEGKLAAREPWKQAFSSLLEYGNPRWFREQVEIILATSFLDAPPRLLPPHELKRLTNAEDFWIRALTFANFADILEKEWRDAFLQSIADRWKAPKPETVRPLIADLDDPVFAVREAAQKKLIGFGHPVTPELQAALRGFPSAELTKRVQSILKEFSAEKLDPRARLCMESLHEQPGTARLLDALAAGPDTDPITKAARERKKDLTLEKAR